MVLASPYFTAVTMYPTCKTVLARSACSVFSDHSCNKTICVSSFIIAAENCFSFVIDATKGRGHIPRKTDAHVIFPESFGPTTTSFRSLCGNRKARRH